MMLLPEIFRQILAMTIPASVVILVVIGMRFLLRKTPRVFAYMLWAAVLFRLLCPVSLSSDFSVFSLLKLPTASVSDVTINISSLFVDRDIAPEQSETALDNFIVAPTPENQAISQPKQELLPAYIWFAGLVALVLYGTIQYFYLLLRLQSAVRYADGIYLADQVNAPFVLGWLRPRIYLPSSIAESERQYIILHEQLHIRRLDHIIRLVSYLALCIHWFNPLVWVAFTLSGNDMELSCDETVIRKMGISIRADYAVSLLKLSCKRRFLRFAPLAFGEANTKKRIHHIAQYKKTGRFVTVICILLSVFTMTACIFNPKTDIEVPSPDITAQNTSENPGKTDSLRAFTTDYLGVWYLSGTNDVTLELSEEYNAAADTYKLFFGFSKMAPKTPFVLPYETLEEQMKDIGIEFKDSKVIVISGGIPFTFVREEGRESVTAQFPHLSAMGRWYFEDNPNGYIDIFTECWSYNYDRNLAIKYSYFDPYDMEYRHGSFWTETGGLLYGGSVFGDENDKDIRSICFQLGTHSMQISPSPTPMLRISGTTFIRNKN